MPTTFRRKGTLPEVNSWNALYNRASGSALWSDSTFAGLDNPVLQANYIAMLAGNTKALQDRLPEDFSFASANTQYSVLATLNAFTQEELQMSDEEYAQAQQNKLNQAFNEQITSDENFQQYGGINEFVQNNYSGDYSKFYQDYGDNYESFMSPENLEYLSPENYDNTTIESTKEAFDYLSNEYAQLETRYSKERDITWTKLLDQIEIEKTEYLRRKAWDEASVWEKIVSTGASFIAMPFTESGEIIEGLIDAGATVAMWISNAFGAEGTANDIRNFIGEDIIPLNTMLKEALPNSWATSDYTSWYNPAKLIYNVGTSIADMAPMALNLAVPGLGTAIYYASSAGRTAEATIQEHPDWSINEITLYTAGATAIEYATEHISGDSIFGPGWFSKYTNIGVTKVGVAVNKALQRPAIKMVKEALGEGLEEVLSELGSSILEGIMTGDFDSAFEDFGTNAIQSFVIGAAMGGVISVSSSAKINRLVNKVHKQIITADGNTITLNMSQSVIVDNFLTEMQERLDNGLTLSKKNQARFDALKSLHIKDMDEAAIRSMFSDARRKSYLNMRGNITYTIDQQIVNNENATEVSTAVSEAPNNNLTEEPSGITYAITGYSALISSARKTPEGYAYTYAPMEEQINEYSVQQENYLDYNSFGYIFGDTGDIARDSIDYYNLPEDMAKKLSTETSILLELQLNALIKEFGQEAAVNGLHIFDQYTINTIDDILNYTKYERYTDEFAKANEEALSKLFGGQQIVFTMPSENDPKTPDGLGIREIISKLFAKDLKLQVQTFITTKSNMPSVFIYRLDKTPTLFINHSLLEAKSFNTMIKLATANAAVYKLYTRLHTIEHMDSMLEIENIITRLNISDIPVSVQTQQLLYIAMFVDDNIIAKKLAWRDLSAYYEVKKILESITVPTGEINESTGEDVGYPLIYDIAADIKNVVSYGSQVYDSTILSMVNPEDVKNYRSHLSTRVTDEFVKNHLRKTPYPAYMRLGQNTSRQAVALMAALETFSKEYGFNLQAIKDLPLDLVIPKIFDRNNYSEDGIKNLNIELGRYYSKRKNLGFRIKLNLYLQDNFGFCVTADNKLVFNYFIEDIINLNELSSRLLPGKNATFYLSEVLTEAGRDYLGEDFRDIIIEFRNRKPGNEFEAEASGYFDRYSGINGKVVLINDAFIHYKAKIQGKYGVINTYNIIETAVHEIQHAFSSMTGISESPAVYMYNSILDIIRAFSLDPEKSKIVYDYLIRNNIISSEYYQTLDQVFSDKDNEKVIYEISQELYNQFYWVFDINENISRDSSGLIASDVQVSSQDITIDKGRRIALLTTNSNDPFLKLFNNLVLYYGNRGLYTYSRIVESRNANKITNDEAIAGLLKENAQYLITPRKTVGKPITFEDIKKLFEDNYTTDISLISTKDYWVSKATNPDLRNYINGLSDLQFRRYLKQYTGVSLDVLAKDFKPDFNVAEFELSRNTNYTGIIAKDIDNNVRLISTANPNSAFSEYNAIGAIIWNAKTNTAIYNFNNIPTSKEVLKAIRQLSTWTKDGGRQRFIVNDRIFNNGAAVNKYLDTAPKNAIAEDSNLAANFDALFAKITKTAIKGPAAVYNLDTIFITNDGQIYNLDSNGNLLQTLKDMCETDYIETIGEVPVDPVTGNALPNETGLTKVLDKLFRDERIVRLSKTNNGWKAYGIPNILQDNFIKLMRAETTSHSYILEGDIGYNIRKCGLVVENDKVKIKYADNNGNIDGQEVPWKTNKWYSAICNIISSYQLTSVNQLSRLGFSDEFITRISTYTGRKLSKKSMKFYNINRPENSYNGIDHSYIIQYINDDTNTELSRNILIANCPDSTTESGNLDWKQNAHIHTVQDAKDYLNIVATYWAAMTIAKDTKVYSNISELHEAYANKINSQDSRYIALSDLMADSAKNTGKITAVLNDDARKAGNIITPRDKQGNITGESYQNQIYHNGLDLSLLAFSNVKYRMEQGEYKLDVEETQDTQNTASGEDIVYLSDIYAAETNAGNVEDILISKETTEALEKLNSDVTKANKDKNLSSRLDKFQKILDNLDSYNLDDDIMGRVRTHLETAIENLANKTIARLSETGIQEEINRISKQFTEDSKLTGNDAVKARVQRNAEYSKLRTDRIRNIARYGEAGYRRILELYSKNNATQMNNITSKFSKFFTRQTSNGRQIAGIKRVYSQLIHTEVPNSDKISLLNEFYNNLQSAIASGSINNLRTFMEGTLRPYILSAIYSGNYNFNGPQDSAVLDAVDGVINNANIADSVKAETLINLLDGYTGNVDATQNISKEAAIRIQYLIDELIPKQISPSRSKRIDSGKLKNILSKTLDESQVNNTVSTIKGYTTVIKYDSARDASVANRWNEIQNENFRINYIATTYDRLIREYKKLAESTPATDDEMSKALKNIYDMITSETFVDENNNTVKSNLFNITRSNYKQIAQDEWKNNNRDEYDFIKKSKVQQEAAKNEFDLLYPIKSYILSHSKDYYDSKDFHNNLLKTNPEYLAFIKNYIQTNILNSNNDITAEWRKANPEAARIIGDTNYINTLTNKYNWYNEQISKLSLRLERSPNNSQLQNELENYQNLLNELLPEYNKIDSYYNSGYDFIYNYINNNPHSLFLLIKNDYDNFSKTFIQNKIREYSNARSNYIKTRTTELRQRYSDEIANRQRDAISYWETNNQDAVAQLKSFEASGRKIFDTYSRYTRQIDDLNRQIVNANSDGNTDLANKLTSQLAVLQERLNEILPEYNRISDILTARTNAINNYYAEHPISIPEEYRIDERSFAQYIEDNIYHDNISSTLAKRLNGLNIIYSEFTFAPKTKAAIEKLYADAKTVLVDGRLNNYVKGDLSKSLMQISDVFDTLDPNKAIAEVLAKFKNGTYIDRSNVIDEIITTQSEQYKKILEEAANNITALALPQETINNAEEIARKRAEEREAKKAAKTAAKENSVQIPDSLDDMDFDDANSEDGDLITSLDEMDFEDSENNPPAGVNLSRSEDDFITDWMDAINEIDEITSDSTNKTKTSEKPKRSEEEMFEPLNTEDVKMHKTIQSPYLYEYGVDIRPAFEYVFEKKEERTLLGKPFDRQIFNTQEFRSNPKIAEIIEQLQNNEEAAAKFVEWAANRPSINSEYQSRMLILLNIIRTAPNLSIETRTAAKEIFEVERSASARNLGLFKNTGLTPTEELSDIALANFSLTLTEKDEIARIIKMQQDAIKNNDYATADKATEDMFKIFETHKHELDNSINFFTAKTPEERAIRLRNLANRLTAYRYFAMLSLPATFFTRNVTSNAILTAMDKTAAGISTIAMKGVEKIAGTKGQYKRTANKVSDNARQAVDKYLVQNGLLDSILNNTVAKYDTGYDYKQTALEKIAADDLLADSSNEYVQALNNKLNERTPFGDGNFGRFLNPIYNKIFEIMDKYDRKVMRKRMIEITEKLVSDNFSSTEIANIETDLNVKKKFDDIVEYSRLEATKIYLRSMPKLYRTIMSALDKYPVAKVITSIIIPFPRMLINTTMTALAYSPFGLIKAGLTLARDQSAFRNITAAKQLGRAVVGTTGIVLGAILASLGLLAIDDDDEYAGPQLVLFGKFSMSLENLSPASLPFIVGASMASDSTAGVWDTLLIGGNALFDATFIGELINSFGGNKEPVDIISNTFASFVTQFIPSFIRRAAQVIDPYQKDTSGNWKFVKRIIQAIPGASLLLDNKVDPYTGEDMTRYTNNNNPWLSRFLAIFNAIYPMQTKYIGESEVETESEAVDAATTGPSSTYTIDGVTYKLSSKQYKDYQKLRAQLYSQYANELINTDRYKKMSMENKRKALKSLQNRATTEARRQLKIGQYAR